MNQEIVPMNRKLRNLSGALGCFLALASGCTANAPGQPGAALAPSSWRLVEFQSMDDAIGTTRPEDASRYTMTLGDDGTVAMQLNCNRASGTWSAEPGADGTSGGFSFGPLAMTRAFCPPPSMDQSIATQAGFVRSFLLRDGRLYLSLMADGGILVWEPDAAAR
jgi:heat shock protein HslJ